MNELKTDINGKFPVVLNDLRFVDNFYRKAIHSIIAGLMRYDGIIYGCDIEIDGNVATMSEGAIWLDGELLQVSEQTFNYDAGNNYFIKLSNYYLPEGRKLFGDNTIHDTYEVRVGIIHDGGSSTSQPNMIRATSSKLVDNAEGRLPRISTHQNAQNGLRPNAIVGTSSSGALVSCDVKSAHNKDFGTGNNNVPRGNHTHSYEPLSLYNGNVTKRAFLDIGAWNMVEANVPSKEIDLINIIDFDIYRVISVDVVIFTDSGRYGGTFHNVKDDMKIEIHKEVGQHGQPNVFNIRLVNYKKTFVNQPWETLSYTDVNRGIVTVTYY